MPEVTWADIATHRERLLRIARRRCPTREDAEDVVSEALLRCATFADLDPARLEAFLTAVTMRLCADLHRRNARGIRAAVRLASDPDVTPGPEDELCGGIDGEVLADLFASLPATQRSVLRDRAHGLSVTQIAQRHALSYKAAESSLARARGAMRAALAASFGVVVTALSALRPRRVAVVAMPVATLALVSTVVRVPLGEPVDPATRQPAAAPEAASTLARDAGDSLLPRTVTPAVRRPVVRPAAAAPRRLVVTSPAAPAPKPPVLEVGNPKYSQTRLRDERPDDWTPDGYVQKCVDEGVWLTLDAQPGQSPVFYQGCG